MSLGGNRCQNLSSGIIQFIFYPAFFNILKKKGLEVAFFVSVFEVVRWIVFGEYF